MQKKILGTFFLILFLGMAFLLYKLLNQNVEVKVELAKVETSLPQEVKDNSRENVWIKEMAQRDSREFVFPVNELFMQIDLRGPDGTKPKSFKLVIDKADRYSLFCIIQTLSSLHLSYVVIKEDKIPVVYIEEKSLKALEKVVQELEKYDIKSKIIEVWL
ncbi:MAG: hypothetical protein J0647_05760 [Campylobacteraceae bacterium]|nr:hypothetical protein [Campylobacteraceae bacterium]